MLKKTLLSALLAALWLSACQPGPSTAPTLVPTLELPTDVFAPTPEATPTELPVEIPDPVESYPMDETLTAPLPSEPDPAESYPADSYPPPPGEYWVISPPDPGDIALERGEFLLDGLTAIPDSSQQGTVDLSVSGALPTTCHQPRVSVTTPDEQNVIALDLYTVVSTDMACAQVTQPYEEKIATLTGLAPGDYSVVMGDQRVAQFSIP